MKRINIAQLDEDAIERLQFAHPGAEFYHDPAVEPGLMSEESPAATNLLEMPAHVADAIDQLEDLPACSATPGCIGKVGHEDDCIVKTTLGEAQDQLGATMAAAAAKLPGDRLTEEIAALAQDLGVKNPGRCQQRDGKGNQCILPAGHELVDHDYIEGADAIIEKPTASAPGDAGLPETLQE